MKIEIIPDILIEESELRFSFIRSGGPGGQNVNKVSTAVQLFFNLRGTVSLDERTRERLADQCAGQINREGELCIEAHSFRTQEQNRREVLRKLGSLITQAQTVQKERIPTRAPKGGGGGAPSTRRTEGKRIRFYDPEEWE